MSIQNFLSNLEDTKQMRIVFLVRLRNRLLIHVEKFENEKYILHFFFTFLRQNIEFLEFYECPEQK